MYLCEGLKQVAIKVHMQGTLLNNPKIVVFFINVFW